MACMTRKKCTASHLFLLNVLLVPAGAHADSIEGKVSVIDGSSFQIVESGLTVKLFGVSACAINQRAHYQGISWPCGAVAAGWLTENTLGYTIRCLKEGAGGYATVLGRCFLPDGSDVAKKALAEGMAIAARDEGILIVPEYESFEKIARSKSLGIWSSTFKLDGQTYRKSFTQ